MLVRLYSHLPGRTCRVRPNDLLQWVNDNLFVFISSVYTLSIAAQLQARSIRNNGHSTYLCSKILLKVRACANNYAIGSVGTCINLVYYTNQKVEHIDSWKWTVRLLWFHKLPCRSFSEVCGASCITGLSLSCSMVDSLLSILTTSLACNDRRNNGRDSLQSSAARDESPIRCEISPRRSIH